jgi:hypothetical protein
MENPADWVGRHRGTFCGRGLTRFLSGALDFTILGLKSLNSPTLGLQSAQFYDFGT